MVMSALRDKIKIVILVTLAAFVGLIFFDWGMQKSRGGRQGSGGVLGQVNGRDISDALYRRTRQDVLASFESRTGRTPEFSDYDAIEEETWWTLVQEMLIREQIEKYGIRVSDGEILEVLKTSPPDFVRSIPDFVNEDGQFDPVRYSQALGNPAYEGLWVQVESYIRQAMPTDKVQNYVGMGARVTTAEIRERFLAENEKVRVRYVVSSPFGVEVAEDEVGDDDLRTYYEAHAGDFRVGPRAILDVVRISKGPSAQDSTETREELEEIREEILQGADFAQEATTWSDDPSAERGGDLGFFSRGDMVPEIEEVAFSLEPGGVSEVVGSPFGYHLVKVEEKKRENGNDQVRVRHILLKVEASRATLRAAADRAEDFLLALEEGGEFEETAREMGLEVETTPPFQRGDYIPGFGLLRSAHRFAFRSEVGAVSTETVEDERFFYVFRLADLREGGVQAFDEVRDRVENLVLQEKRREIAREKLAAAVARSDGSLPSIARALGAEVDSTGEFSRASPVPGVGQRNAFVATAFTLTPNDVSGIVDSDRGFYVMEVLERIPADEADFVEQKDLLRVQLLGEKRQSLIAAWMEQLILDAQIVDLRGGAPVEWKPDPSDLVYAGGA